MKTTASPGIQKIIRRLSVLALGMCLLVGSPTSARAEKSDASIILTTTLYGVLGGTALGLVTYPFTQTHQSILIGAGVGLVLGVIVGVYHAKNRDDPENPLRSRLETPGVPLSPRLQLDDEPVATRTRLVAPAEPGLHLAVAYPVFRF